MLTATVQKNFSQFVIGVTAIITGAALVSAGTAYAAILTVGDIGRWGTGGENTLSNLGFNMVSVPDDTSVPGKFTSVTAISSPSNVLSFSNPLQKAYVGTDWAFFTNSRFNPGSAVYYNNGINTTTISIFFAEAVAAFDFLVETNAIESELFDISVTASGSISQTLTQGLQGNIGGKYFGFYTTGTDLISSITITAPTQATGFAIGEFRLGNVQQRQVPEPTSTLSLLALGAIATGSMLKSKKS